MLNLSQTFPVDLSSLLLFHSILFSTIPGSVYSLDYNFGTDRMSRFIFNLQNNV